MAMDLENIMQDTIVIEARFREKKGETSELKRPDSAIPDGQASCLLPYLFTLCVNIPGG